MIFFLLSTIITGQKKDTYQRQKMLTIKNVSKSFGNVQALNNVSFSVDKSKVTGFLGPNGAGKTTLLRIITGYLEADKGKVTLDKKSIGNNFKSAIAEIGYLPENNPLYKSMRVDEFLTFTAKTKGNNDKGELREISEKCGITSVLSQEIEHLSKGYKQRVGLAKALIGNPKFLILDEPTTGLDPNQKDEILKLIQSYAKDKTVFFSSHVLSEVTQIADNIIIINDGEIVAQGKREELLKQHFREAKIFLKTDASSSSIEKTFRKIKLISSFKKISKGKQRFLEYEVICSEAEKTSLEIFEVIVKNKWNLVELHTESQGLEELFKEVTT